MRRLAHALEYALVLAVVRLGRLLGDSGAARLGEALGRAAYRPFRVRRDVVESQLAASFADRDAAWVRATAAAAYAHLGREALAMARLASMSAADVRARTEVDGLDAFLAALGRGRGLVLVTGHLGNWEIGGAALAARGVPLDAIARRQRNPLVDRLITDARERLGMRVVERGRATRVALRSLREGRVVAFVADQDARDAGVFVPFLGRPASTARGPALLALRAGAPIFVGTALRERDGRWRIVLREVEPPPARGTTEDRVVAWTAAYTARLEQAIRSAPEQYFWHHRRWKTAAPSEQAPGGAGITLSSSDPRPARA